MDVADPREEVVLDLEAQSADEPCQHATARSEIDGRFDLVYGPTDFDPAGVRARLRKGGLLHTVRHLKHDTQPSTPCTNDATP